MERKREQIICTSDEFIIDVAKDCIANLTKREIEELMDFPCSTKYHYTYGMYIRNQYILCKDFSKAGYPVEPDDLSGDILEMIFSMLLPGYVYGNRFITSMFDNKQYLSFRRSYKNRYGEYPDEWLAVYEEKENQEFEKQAIKSSRIYREFMAKKISGHVLNQAWNIDSKNTEERVHQILSELSELVWKTDEFYEMTDLIGIERNEIMADVESVKKLFWNEDIFVPIEVCLLKFKDKIGQEKYKNYCKMLKDTVAGNPELLEKMDDRIKEKYGFKQET